jgi:hypothetical protein
MYADAQIIAHLQKVGVVCKNQFPNLRKVIVGLRRNRQSPFSDWEIDSCRQPQPSASEQ